MFNTDFTYLYLTIDKIYYTFSILINIDTLPLFVDAANGDFHLQSSSPCIDAGDGAVLPLLDIEGVARDDDGSGGNNSGSGPPWVDMGAFEFD